MSKSNFSPDLIAEVCHEANRTYAQRLGDISHVPWKLVSEELKASAINGVKHALDNPDITPEALQAEWRRFKESQGWKYGPTKSEEHKTHPNLIPFGDLAPEERAKDALFLGIVRAFQNS